ncbi:hypothetical protein [Terrisporobacter vanillatitrophus]
MIWVSRLPAGLQGSEGDIGLQGQTGAQGLKGDMGQQAQLIHRDQKVI